jgi:hypothetical protein
VRWFVITLILGLAACETGSNSTRSTSTTSTTAASVSHPVGTVVAKSIVACEQRINSSEQPSRDVDVVLDVVALPTSKVYKRALQTSTYRGDGPRLFAKTGLEVRTGSHVEISAAPDSEGRLWFNWGNAGTPSARVVVDRCASTSSSETWIAFAGGYYVDEPGCFPVRITDDAGHTKDVSIGIGAPCPGQRPPVEPTDG